MRMTQITQIHAVIPCLTRNPLINDEIAGQARNDDLREFA